MPRARRISAIARLAVASVVKLAGDPKALLGRRLPGLLLSFQLQPGGPVLELGGMHPPMPHALAQGPGGGQQHPVVEQVVKVGDRDVRPGRRHEEGEADGEQARPGHDAQDGQLTVTVRGQRVHGEVESQEGERGAVEPGGPLDRHRSRADGEDRERHAPANHQREGLEQHERDVEGAAVPPAGRLLQLGQGQSGGDQRHQPVRQQRVQPRQPGTNGDPSVHGQTLAAAPTMRIPLPDDRHPQGSSRRRRRASTTADALEADHHQAGCRRTYRGKGIAEDDD
jgi:hypothetical protein